MKPRTVMVIGSGGREHALARRLAADPEPARVILAPGNDGAAREFDRREVAERDLEGLVSACAAESPELVVVGPEGPLAAGIADALAARGLAVFGPVAAAARLESSKWFAKEVMAEARVPTAAAECFDDAAIAVAALDRFGPPWVLKADGLAAGKGVCVTSDRAEAEAFARGCLAESRFGEAGRTLLIERFLEGEEVSVMAVCDGEDAVLLPAARDFKRARDGDAGPNTGGMGAFAPAPALDAAAAAMVRERVVLPVLAALARRGIRYRGVLYCGLMLTATGPQVVEFNVRFGDPEAQVILPRIGGSLFELLSAAAGGRVADVSHAVRPGATVAVALVDSGYPGSLEGSGIITGTERLEPLPGTWMLYAGVREAAVGWRVAGGRAAYVCAEGDSLEEARQRAYVGVGLLGGTGWRFRRDIANIRAFAADPSRVKERAW